MPRVQKANSCLKCCFILFSVLLGIAGCVLLILASMARRYADEVGDAAGGLWWLYVMAVACIILCIMGTFGAYKENTVALRLCLGEMVGGAIALFIVGNKVSQLGPQVKQVFQTHLHELKPAFLGNDNFRSFEMLYECCGVEGYRDYSSLQVPNSCECLGEDRFRCTTIPTTTFNSFYGHRTLDDTTATPKHVYRQPCLPIILKTIDDAIRLVLGFVYGFAAAAVLGALLCACLLCQIGGYMEPEASPVRGSTDWVTVSNTAAVPTMRDPMISAVPMPYYPANMGTSAHPSIHPSSTAHPEPGRGMSAY